jgi:radical SAM superfamily enzyme YgiQ (UPF0313 family)
MHYTGTLYRNPYVAPSPLLEITQGCTHNQCKFCTMYKDVPFRMSPLTWVEEDLQEIASVYPNTDRLQFVGADPFALSYDRMKVILELVHKYLPDIKHISMAARVSNVENKTVEQLKELHDLGITEIFFGVESGDEWTLNRIQKGYHADEIIPLVSKLDEAGIAYWLTFLNGVAGKSHSREHAIHTAEIFNQLHPVVVGSGSLTLFPGTPLLEEAVRGEFDPLDETDLLKEMRLFLEHLTCDAYLITHHTFAANLTGKFLENKEKILQKLDYEIAHCDESRLERIRRMKSTL